MHLVHLLAAYAVLLSNLSTALRDETSRLNLEALLCCPVLLLKILLLMSCIILYNLCLVANGFSIKYK